MPFTHVAEEADRDEYALDALNVTAGDTMREALAVQCWLDADAMRAHAVEFRSAGVSAEVLPVVRVDVHGVREGTRIADYLTGLDKRPGGRGATGGGVEAGAAGRAESSRRKTTRAVIMRTIIDGTTDMRESPDWIVLAMQISDGFDQGF